MNYNYDFLIASFIIYAILLYSVIVKKPISSQRSKNYISMIVVGIFISLTDLLSAYGIDHPDRIPMVINYLFSSTYFLLCIVNACLFLYFNILIVHPRGTSISKKVKLMIFRLGTIVALFLFTTPLTHLFYYFDESNGLKYTWGPLMFLSGGLMYIVIFSAFIYSMLHRTSQSQKHWAISFSYIFTLFLVTLFQLSNRRVLLTSFGISLACWMMNTSLEDFSYYVNLQNGSYSRTAFLESVANLIERKNMFKTVLIYFSGLDLVKDKFGADTYDNVIFNISSTLTNKMKIDKLYQFSNSGFCILLSQDQNELQVANEIQVLFDKNMPVGKIIVPISVKTAVLSDSSLINDPDEFMSVTDFAFELMRNSHEKTVMIIDSDLLNQMNNRSNIFNCLNDAVRYGKFEIYYQPILNTNSMKFETAEALIRLKDNEGHFISPEIFIPLAEQNGMIFQIGEFVLREVCRFIRSSGIRDLGVKSIHVNLSSLQCVQQDLSSNLAILMKEYGIKSTELCLEITETAAVLEDRIIKKNMSEIISNGTNFAMDDFGSGFANTLAVMNYPFSSVKLDKQMVWMAFDNEKAWKTLKYSVEMFKSINLNLVAEGVESIDQAKRLIDIGCDYLQGFYYSKPIDGDHYIEFLKQHQ